MCDGGRIVFYLARPLSGQTLSYALGRQGIAVWCMQGRKRERYMSDMRCQGTLKKSKGLRSLTLLFQGSILLERLLTSQTKVFLVEGPDQEKETRFLLPRKESPRRRRVQAQTHVPNKVLDGNGEGQVAHPTLKESPTKQDLVLSLFFTTLPRHRSEEICKRYKECQEVIQAET